jgi:hypothetical protein
MILRQLVIAANDLDATTDLLSDRLGVTVAFRDPGVAEFGLRNAVLPVGDHFLEVVSPVMAGAPAARFLTGRPDGSGYMAILQVPDLDRLVAVAERIGLRTVWTGERTDEQGAIRGRHLHPGDLGCIVSLDEAAPVGAWPWAGPAWRTPSCAGRGEVTGLSSVTIAVRDVDAVCTVWSALLGVPAAPLMVLSGSGEIRIVPAGDGAVGIVAFGLRAAPGVEPRSFTVGDGGVRIDVR